MTSKYYLLITLFWMLAVSTNVIAGETLEERLSAASHPATNTADLFKYAQDDNWRVREVIARRQTAPADVLRLLTNDPVPKVRSALAHNLRAPRDAVAPLVNDPSIDVRLSVAHCGYTPPDLLVKLLEDPELKVRRQAVVNLNVPLDALRRVAQGKSDIADIAHAALEKRESEATE